MNPFITLQVSLVYNIQMEGTVSQIFDLGLSFNFMQKNG